MKESEIEVVGTKENKLDYVEENVSTLKHYFYVATKRVFDIVVSLIGMVFLIPIAIVVKLIYIFTGDFHSIFYTQTRIGKNGKLFKLYKFRSMTIDADDMLVILLKENKELRKEYAKNKKLQNDPRITKAGKFIRRYSIDELPQLLNIFIGNMSLIGNRPYLPKEKKDMKDYYKDIVKTKPGLTGFWQVSGRNDISFEKRLQLERYYSNHQGFRLDIHIFFKTFKVVLFGYGI